MQVFFAPKAQLGFFGLTEDESKHVIRVLRMNQGDPVFVVDGCGRLFEGTVAVPHPKRCILQLIHVREDFEKRPYKLHMAISPLKSVDRLEWFIEKAVEIGIDEITPLACERTEKKNVNTDRLLRIVESAMKQSLKAFQPAVNELIAFQKFISQEISPDVQKGIAFCGEGEKEYIGKSFSAAGKYLILIGPEGDFSEEEVKLALSKGFKGISLGESRLRTETAGIVACQAVSFINTQ